MLHVEMKELLKEVKLIQRKERRLAIRKCFRIVKVSD